MLVFRHHIYEYKKGLRNLILHTASESDIPEIERTLMSQDISYKIEHLNNGYANVFFGNEECIKVLEIIGNKKLTDFTKEEDFILGIMLGYGRIEECKRYIFLSQKESARFCSSAAD